MKKSEYLRYQYPFEHPDVEKVKIEALEKYRKTLHDQVSTLLGNGKLVQALCDEMEERTFKIEMYHMGFGAIEFLEGLIEHRGIENDDTRDSFDVLGTLFGKVDSHLSSEFQESKLKIGFAPKNKEELNKALHLIDDGYKIETLDDKLEIFGVFEKKNEKKSVKMDLRLSAVEKIRDELGKSDIERINFLKTMEEKKDKFRNKMKRLKAKERKRKEDKRKETDNIFKRQNEQHHIEIGERYRKRMEDIEKRKQVRIEKQKQYLEHKKLNRIKKPHFIRYQERYQRDYVSIRDSRADNILQNLKKKNQPMKFENLNEHMKQYDAKRKLVDIRMKSFSSHKSLMHRSSMKQMRTSNQNDEKFREMINRRSAANMYAKKVQKKFKRTHYAGSSHTTLPKLKKQQVSGHLLKKKRYEMGNTYLRQGQLNALDKSKTQSRIKNKLEHDMASKRRMKPNHKNYLIDLRKSKILQKQQNKETWKKVMGDEDIDPKEKFELMKVEMEMKDSEIKLIEERKKLGLIKKSKDMEDHPEEMYLGSIKAKLALLGQAS